MINNFKKLSDDRDYFFLSNFYPCKIEYEGLAYCSAEAAFQAAKSLDMQIRRKFLYLSPREAKRLGRRIPLRQDWEYMKDIIMMEILRIKFSDPDLAHRLLSTGYEQLVEGNTWHDNYWGDCRCENCSSISGQNHLGQLLMQLRHELGGY